jgi:hypothetical protein
MNPELTDLIKKYETFDDLLESGDFAKLEKKDMENVYFYFENSAKTEYDGRVIADYISSNHKGQIDELLEDVASTFVCGDDIYELEDLGYSIRVCEIDDQVVGVLAYQNRGNFNYIGIVVANQKQRGKKIGETLLEDLASDDYPYH